MKRIIRPERKYFELFYDNLRKEDKKEVIKTVKDKKEFLKLCTMNLNANFLALENGFPLAMGGVKDVFFNDLKLGQIWLLATNKLYTNRICVYRYVKYMLNFYKKEYDFLFNYIYKSNFKALNWLEKSGFKTVALSKTLDFKLFYFIKGDFSFDLRYFTG